MEPYINVRSLCVVLCCMIYNASSANDSEVLDLSKAICKYNSFDCHNQSHPMPPNGTASCCQDCVCSDGCVHGNCCPNALINPNITAECVSQTDLLGNHRYLWHFFIKFAFYTIVSCPDDASEALKSACDAPTHIEDYNFVSDARNNNIFKNKYCALCNGVTEFRNWQQGLLLEEDVYINDLFEIIKGGRHIDVRAISQIYSLPPDDFPYWKYMCGHYIDTCSSRYSSNATVKYLCEESSFNNAYTLFYRSFKNVYCAICNVDDIDKLQSICPAISDLRGFLDRNRYTRLTVLLDGQWQSVKGNNSLIPEIKICAKDEVLDPLTNNCISLRCPIGQFAYFGYCLSYKYSTIALGIGLILEIKIVPFFNKTIYRHPAVIQQLRAVLGTANCQECFFTIFAYNNGSVSKDILHIAPFTTTQCNESFVINSFERVFHDEYTSFIMLLENSTFTVHLQMLGREFFDAPYSNNNLVYLFDRDTSCTHVKYLDFKFFCPSVNFNSDAEEFQRLPKHFQDKLLTTSAQNNINGSNTSNTICWRSYKMTVNEALLVEIKTSTEMTIVGVVCSGILACFSILTVIMNSKTPDVPGSMKFITAMVSLAIMLGRCLDEVFTKMKVLGRLNCLIMNQSVGSLLTVFVGFVQVGVFAATKHVNSLPNGLDKLHLRLRLSVLIGLFVAVVFALCEGIYLYTEQNTFEYLRSTSMYFVPHSITCFCPTIASLITSLVLLFKTPGVRLAIESPALYTLSLAKGLFFVSIFSTIFEIVRTVKDFTLGPHFLILLYILCIPYGILIFIGLSVNTKQFVIDSLVRVWYWFQNSKNQ